MSVWLFYNLVLLEAYGKKLEMTCFLDRIFFMPMFYIVKSLYRWKVQPLV